MQYFTVGDYVAGEWHWRPDSHRSHRGQRGVQIRVEHRPSGHGP